MHGFLHDQQNLHVVSLIDLTSIIHLYKINLSVDETYASVVKCDFFINLQVVYHFNAILIRSKL